jgi:hypothetical protein
MREVVAQITFEARGSNEINQSSGVSVRVTINNYESLLSNAEKRAVRLGEREIVRADGSPLGPRLDRRARSSSSTWARTSARRTSSTGSSTAPS